MGINVCISRNHPSCGTVISLYSLRYCSGVRTRVPGVNSRIAAQKPITKGTTCTAGSAEYKEHGSFITLDIAMEQITHHRQTLNNYLQEVYRDDPRRRLTWETSHDGPDNLPTWRAIAYLNGVEWGRGNGPSRGAAMEAAAKRVLIALGVQSQDA